MFVEKPEFGRVGQNRTHLDIVGPDPFGDRFDARPDDAIAEEFRRDDTLAIPIAWDAMAGAGGAVYGNDRLAALCATYPDVFLPGWAVVDPWRGRSGLAEIEHAIREVFSRWSWRH